MKILYAASEALPFIRSGGLGDVAGSLPGALNGLKNDCRVILPLYEGISAEYRQTMKFLGVTYVDLAWRRQYCGVYESQANGVTYYFIDNEYYFKRKGLYGHFDDGERFAFFAKAVLESMTITGFYPDIINANDWHTALVPVFLDVFYRGADKYKNIRTVFTIHNIEFQGKYDMSIARDILGLSPDATKLVESSGCVNYMKGGIESASMVTTVSETYANEILDPFYSYGLEGILSARRNKIHGVVNGVDVDLFNPATDKALFENYSLQTVANKKENKKGLCEMLGISYSADRPLYGMVTRLTEQKGLDLVARVIEEILSADLQLVILGTGDWKYEAMLKSIEEKYSSKFKVIINFSPDIASKIYAASDLFLMPSKFEPCGLSQMIAMRYGSVPIVRETGGLKDTVIPFNPAASTGLGFTFASYNAHDMLNTIWNSFATYHDKAAWKKVQSNAMKADFSWKVSAKKIH